MSFGDGGAGFGDRLDDGAFDGGGSAAGGRYDSRTRISAASLSARSWRPPLVNCSMESLPLLDERADDLPRLAVVERAPPIDLAIHQRRLEHAKRDEADLILTAHRIRDRRIQIVDESHQTELIVGRRYGLSWLPRLEPSRLRRRLDDHAGSRRADRRLPGYTTGGPVPGAGVAAVRHAGCRRAAAAGTVGAWSARQAPAAAGSPAASAEMSGRAGREAAGRCSARRHRRRVSAVGVARALNRRRRRRDRRTRGVAAVGNTRMRS